MTRIILSLFLLLFLSSSVYADVIITLDLSSFTQTQKNHLKAIGYRIAYEQGENEVPGVVGNQLIFNNLSESTQALMTEENIIAEFEEAKAEMLAASEAEKILLENLRASIITKYKGLGFTNEELKYMYLLFTN